jgi:hypothetical protein
MAGERDAGKKKRGEKGSWDGLCWAERVSERARAQAGRAVGLCWAQRESGRVCGLCVWLGRTKRREAACVANFVFLFKKCEIVIVFVYFSKIFKNLQKY